MSASPRRPAPRRTGTFFRPGMVCVTLGIAAWIGCAAVHAPSPKGAPSAETSSTADRQPGQLADTHHSPAPATEHEGGYFYVIRQRSHTQDVVRLPLTAGYTVLDAIAQMDEPAEATKARIWIERPDSDPCKDSQVLPVDWNAIVRGGTTTNHFLKPNDRIYVVDRQTPLSILRCGIASVLSRWDRIRGIPCVDRAVLLPMESAGEGEESLEPQARVVDASSR
jgi:hypothetical protein